jgi:P-type conjugative transfer protein TrbG
MVQETTAESEIDGRTIVLVKPQTTGLRTNIVLVTDRRTYTIEAIAQAGSAYSAQIAWCYPAEEEARMASVDQLHFGYRVRAVRGGRPNWMPTRVFDDGRRTWIEMPEAVASSDLPPLFVITGEGAELVNYRVQGQRYMVDRVFDVAELRLGTRAPTIVRIEREPHCRNAGPGVSEDGRERSSTRRQSLRPISRSARARRARAGCRARC